MNAIINATLSFLAHVASVLAAAYTSCSEAVADHVTPRITNAVTSTKGAWASLRSNVATRVAAHAARVAA